MKSEKAGTPAPKLSNTASASMDEAARTVTFTDRPQFAIHPVTITIPWAVVKMLGGTILSHEAQMEMGGGIKTEVVNQSPKTKS